MFLNIPTNAKLFTQRFHFKKLAQLAEKMDFSKLLPQLITLMTSLAFLFLFLPPFLSPDSDMQQVLE